MPRQLIVAHHHSDADLERGNRAARDPVERTDWQLVWLVASGRTYAEAAPVTG